MALFDCKIQATSGHARALSYETAHGTFQTPMFMPVGTSATVKGVTAGQLRDLDSQVVLANTYHLSLRPGADVVAEAGGVQREVIRVREHHLGVEVVQLTCGDALHRGAGTHRHEHGRLKRSVGRLVGKRAGVAARRLARAVEERHG